MRGGQDVFFQEGDEGLEGLGLFLLGGEEGLVLLLLGGEEGLVLLLLGGEEGLELLLLSGEEGMDGLEEGDDLGVGRWNGEGDG